MDRRALYQRIDELLGARERPSEALEALRREGALADCPELLALLGVPQDPTWHPEGDVWVHTLMVIDEAARQRPDDEAEARLLRWAALCHDLGKPACTVFERGGWHSPGHDRAGVSPSRALLTRLGADEALIDGVCRLVNDHLAPHFFAPRASPASVRRLVARLGPVPLPLLVRLGRADSFGRTTEQARRREYPSGEWLLERAASLGPAPPELPPPLVHGRDLLPLGFQPGPALGRALRRLHEAQLEGRFDDREGGLRWLREQGLGPE